MTTDAVPATLNISNSEPNAAKSLRNHKVVITEEDVSYGLDG